MNIHVSVSTNDKLYLEKFIPYLKILKKYDYIKNYWHRGQVQLGDDQLVSTMASIQEADIMIAMLSTDYMIDCEEELGWMTARLNNQQAKIIPFIVRPCPWRNIPSLKDLHPVPKDGQAISQARDIDLPLNAAYEEIQGLILQIRNDQAYTDKIAIKIGTLKRTYQGIAANARQLNETFGRNIIGDAFFAEISTKVAELEAAQAEILSTAVSQAYLLDIAKKLEWVNSHLEKANQQKMRQESDSSEHLRYLENKQNHDLAQLKKEGDHLKASLSDTLNNLPAINQAAKSNFKQTMKTQFANVIGRELTIFMSPNKLGKIRKTFQDLLAQELNQNIATYQAIMHNRSLHLPISINKQNLKEMEAIPVEIKHLVTIPNLFLFPHKKQFFINPLQLMESRDQLLKDLIHRGTQFLDQNQHILAQQMRSEFEVMQDQHKDEFYQQEQLFNRRISQVLTQKKAKEHQQAEIDQLQNELKVLHMDNQYKLKILAEED